MCGSTGWFPGYPAMMRALSWLGMRTDVAGVVISWVAQVGLWAVLWLGFLRRRPRGVGLAAMAAAAAFPASVYLGAIFPVSLLVLATVSALVCADRERWLAAGCCAAVAAVVYPSGTVVGSLALLPLVTTSLGGWSRRITASAAVAGPAVFAYVLVLANFQQSVGAWNAWFQVQAAYDFGVTFPPSTIVRQIRHVGGDAIPAAVGLQTLLVTVSMAAVVWIAARSWRAMSLGERGTVIVAVPLWILPLTLGGDLSLYRAESLLLPIVIVLARLRGRVLVGYALVCVPLCCAMAVEFFESTLI